MILEECGPAVGSPALEDFLAVLNWIKHKHMDETYPQYRARKAEEAFDAATTQSG